MNLSYQSHRAIHARLDKVGGPENWQDQYIPWKKSKNGGEKMNEKNDDRDLIGQDAFEAVIRDYLCPEAVAIIVTLLRREKFNTPVNEEVLRQFEWFTDTLTEIRESNWKSEECNEAIEMEIKMKGEIDF